VNEPDEVRQRDDRGASAVEYGLLIAGIAAFIVTVVFVFGGGASSMFHKSCEDIMENQNVGTCPH
jgi:pilus assembly protein Flp/PilA